MVENDISEMMEDCTLALLFVLKQRRHYFIIFINQNSEITEKHNVKHEMILNERENISIFVIAVFSQIFIEMIFGVLV